MRLRHLLPILLIAAVVLLFLGSVQSQEYDYDQPTADELNGDREEAIEEQREQIKKSQTDIYGCPVEAPYICVTDPFTLNMTCNCAGMF